VIEHLANDKGLLDEIHRVLRPDGKFILTTPNRLYRLLPFQKPRNPYHVREYTPRGLEKILTRKFSPVSVKGVWTRPGWMERERARFRQNPVQVYGVIIRRWLARGVPALNRIRISPYITLRDPQHEIVAEAERIGLPTDLPETADFFLSDEARSGLDLFAVATKSMDG
jgi:SAM-dependent methyltransferase